MKPTKIILRRPLRLLRDLLGSCYGGRKVLENVSCLTRFWYLDHGARLRHTVINMGDRVGRKYTFLITLSGMALGTGAIGLIPTFEQIGLAAAFILFGLRMIQGLCLGGQYGGAITYVAEHVSDERRGYYTGWLQTSPTLGIVLSLIVIIATRTYFGEAAFNAWAWRIPFLFSFLLVLIAIYIRVNFQESPIFEELKAKQGMTKNPWKEAFLSSNIKFVLIATVVVLGQGVVWYSLVHR